MPAGNEPSSQWPRRERWTALGVAAALVIARSLVFLIWEQAHFDSDQAINGLMAKHLAEGRAFPLFFYGQGYMLAVEAWLAAPWLAVFGATVASLRASLIATNIAVAWLLILGLERWCGLRPMLGLVASLFFVLAPPVLTSQLIEAQGGDIEPFLYIVVLWFLRDRPLIFGAVLGIGFLNREFTAYAVPILLVGQVLSGRYSLRSLLQHWTTALVSFVAVWEIVMALQPWADFYGPGTRGDLLSGYVADPVSNLLARGQVAPVSLWTNVVNVLRVHLALLLDYHAPGPVLGMQGHRWVGWLLVTAAAVVVGRLVLHAARATRARGRPADRIRALIEAWRVAAFGWYLLGVGSVSLGVYVLSRPALAGTFRYVLLTILMAVGLTASFLRLEPDRRFRRFIVAAAIVWSAASAYDSGRLLQRFVTAAPPDQARELIDTLRAQGVQVAEADYWLAYKLTFLSGETLKVASTDFIRIKEYQQLAARARPHLLRIGDDRCAGGQEIAGWWVCPRH